MDDKRAGVVKALLYNTGEKRTRRAKGASAQNVCDDDSGCAGMAILERGAM